MPGLENQEMAFAFFCEHLESQAVFEKDDLRAATNWSDSAVSTYWSKQFRPFVREVDSGRYRVTEAFRPFSTWDRFRQHVTHCSARASSAPKRAGALRFSKPPLLLQRPPTGQLRVVALLSE